jgi:nucleotide-binding universal stress UspA family protein
VILICYDGSPDAQSAIDRAGELLAGKAATVLTIWEPFIDVMARSGAGLAFGSGTVEVDEIDAASEKAARERAEEGVKRAKKVGLNAQPRTRARLGTVAETILAEAGELDAEAIVMGTRGLTGLKSVLLGSVSHAVVQHANRPVVVVPSAEVAAARAAGGAEKP